MKKPAWIFCCLLAFSSAYPQSIGPALQKAFAQFEQDSQLKYAISSLHVIDAKTGEVIFGKNERIGLAPASTQKIITSVTAFELMGADYRYKTTLGYDGTIKGDRLEGNLRIGGSGDPTLGSWRYASTRDTAILAQWTKAIAARKISGISGKILIETGGFEPNSIPDGWIWQDIGNYYGAGAGILNWHENQFDLLLRSGSQVGDAVDIAGTMHITGPVLKSLARAARKGSGDNAYIYPAIGNQSSIVTGTIPVDEKRFTISGAQLNPPGELVSQLTERLRAAGISVANNTLAQRATDETIHTHFSPALDSIIYLFNRKSINLYGEALMKTMALEKAGFASTDSGVNILRRFWEQKGLDKDELNMVDGSGLSPLNRVTTHAQVEILRYARSQKWYSQFYDALPEFNGMKMKSGTIRNVKGFCGYHKSSNGREYIFSFLVNNYNGSASALVKKMYAVLDVLK